MKQVLIRLTEAQIKKLDELRASLKIWSLAELIRYLIDHFEVKK